jgi:hypothetical protein
MNPLAIAIQGLGFGPAMVALQGLLVWVADEVRKWEEAGGDAPVPRSRARRELVQIGYPALPAKPSARTRAKRDREFPVLL